MKKIAIAIVVGVFVLSACGEEKSEKERFVDATIETSCMLFDASKIGDADESTVIESTKKIFKKHGFDVNDETKMNAITDRYTNNEEVSKLVENGLSKKCPGDVAEGLLDVSADTKTGEK